MGKFIQLILSDLSYSGTITIIFSIVAGNLIALAAIKAVIRAAPVVLCLPLLIAAVVVAMIVTAIVSSGVRPDSIIVSIFQDPLLF